MACTRSLRRGPIKPGGRRARPPSAAAAGAAGRVRNRHDPKRIRYGCFLPDLTGLATAPPTPAPRSAYIRSPAAARKSGGGCFSTRFLAVRRACRARPRWSRKVVPAYSVRKRPRACRIGTTPSTKASNCRGKNGGITLKPSAARPRNQRSSTSAICGGDVLHQAEVGPAVAHRVGMPPARHVMAGHLNEDAEVHPPRPCIIVAWPGHSPPWAARPCPGSGQ
jgi:hypothetical protein